MTGAGSLPPRVDYDRIASRYDEPIRDHPVDPELIACLASRTAPERRRFRVLDLGCGTGKQLTADKGAFPEIVAVGIDVFAGMLRVALARCADVHWVRADAAALPLRDATIDHATSQFSYQHVRRTPRLLGEVSRVLAPGGRFVMRNIDPWSMPRWLVYRFFPDAFEVDRRDFVPVDEFVAEMTRVGFTDVRVERTDLTREESLDEFLAFASERHRASQLLAISEDAHRAGIARIRSTLAAAPGGLSLRSEFVLVKVQGKKP